ncbi:OPT super [Malassezia cuniculi]|uniref:OPT super n=1 Tax=Malassezia cuniculi TaxID=948313 RepID=A0AAF0JCV2_9BASI|nr:OPT super [Malassezia cuniculi]
MTLQGSLLGYAVFRLIPRHITVFGRRITIMEHPLTPRENIVLQTVATSVGCLPLSSGAIGVLPALSMLDPKIDGAVPIIFHPLALSAWTAGLSIAGIFFASPLRDPMILKEKLPYPTGTATALLVSMLHDVPLHRSPVQRRSAEAEAEAQAEADTESDKRRIEDVEHDAMRDGTAWRLLAAALVISAAFAILALFFPVCYAVPLFDVVGISLTRWGWWFTPSFSYIGQGMIMGIDTSVNMAFGALVGWGILGPLAQHMGWAHGEPLDGMTGARGWIVWIAVAIMCAESITEIAALGITHISSDLLGWMQCTTKRVKHNVSKFICPKCGSTQCPGCGSSSSAVDDCSQLLRRRATDADASADEDDEPPERLTSSQWILYGLAISTILGIVLVCVIIGDHIAPWATAVAFICASIFSILAARALGETDLNPVGGIAKLSQILFGVLQPGNTVANIVAGAISEAGALQAGELMQDYKTGHLVGVAPWNLFRGQLLGSILGIGFLVYGYNAYQSTYAIPGPQFPAPSANIWLSFARLINHGEMPEHAGVFMAAAALIFTITGGMRAFARAKGVMRARCAAQGVVCSPSRLERIASYLPSGIAFSVGMIITPNFSIARVLGGVLAYKYMHYMRSKGIRVPETPLGSVIVIVIASGFVLGEGVASIALDQ